MWPGSLAGSPPFEAQSTLEFPAISQSVWGQKKGPGRKAWALHNAATAGTVEAEGPFVLVLVASEWLAELGGVPDVSLGIRALGSSWNDPPSPGVP